jgi:hypothetical protein
MNISMSGVSGIPYNNINLFTLNKNTLDSSSSILFGSAYDQEYYFGPNLYVSGRSNKFAEQILPLIVQNNLIDQMASGNLSLSTYNIISSDYVNNSFPLYIKSYPQLISSFNRESVNLFTSVDNFTDFYKASSQQNFNLFILGLDLKTYGSGLFNLFTINYPASNQSLSSQSTISWNGNNSGKNIDVDDNSLAYVDADDEIRGVDLLCYGSCPTGLCKEDIVSIHEVNWSTPSLCSDGGIFRAKQTYTNLSLPSGSFKHTLPTSSYDQLVTEDSFVISSENGSLFITESSDSVVYDPMPYSGHFYGIRKYTGLVPNSPYAINIVGKTGSNNSITLPKEFTEMEYGIDSEVAYSGIKIVNDDYRESGVKFGKSIAVKKDLIAIGSPFQNLEYQEYNTDGNLTTITLNDAGSIFLYRRDARPSDYTWPQNTAKSSWNLETRLSLPSGLLKDYPTISTVTKIDDTDLPLPVTVRSWNVGQEGRRLGHSIDLAINSEVKSFEEDSRQIIVAGGPTASWSRDFEDLQTSGVQIGLIIFTDEFSPQVGYDPVKKRPKNYTDVLESIKNKDLLYRYYSDPPIQFNVKLIICEPIIGFSDSIVEFPAPQPDFIVKKQIYRNDGPPNADQTSRILSGIKEAFHEAFPYDTSKIHNNVPPLVGLYVDNSDSLGLDALNPALNQFIDYYKKYSFDNGLTDFYGVRSSGSLFSYEPSEGGGEDWITMSQSILDEVLDTGRLLIDNQVRFLTSGVGEQYFNQNLKEFNYPPESGGRVYIFEKESGSWNLVQEIKSPNITYSTPDRFGHAVAISDDSEIIAIGSPYIDQACQVFEYKPEEKARLYSGLYSWLQYKNSATGGLLSKYSQLINQFSSWSSEYGYTYATYILYSKLDSTDKFEARQYLNIQEYQNIYTYSYSHIGSIGDTWNFIPDHFAPTSRLGYSVAVNEDGTLVAFGSPTDSFNEYEDNNVYYKNDGYSDPSNDENLNTNIIKPNWRSSTNAGAVRIFESRRYYPHDTVVEFTKFGNLQESMKYPEDSGHFNYLASIFNDKNFRKTEFTEVDIPQNAGLAFIITPEVDALSDEVADNILNWLALGDRNLVLVGNDPIWEKNGIYSISNNIINKILTKLESRIKLYPARNSYEALSSGCSLAIPSYRPANSSSSYVQSYDLKAYGVADIRMNIGNNLINRYMPCPDPSDDTLLNDKCEMPLKDIGDLRAEWTESCLNCAGQEVLYKVNWPFIFKTYTPPCCDTEPLDNDPSRQDWHNQEPIPLLVAADYVTETIVIPYSPASSGLRPIYETIAVGTPINIFDYNNISPSAINIWDSGNNIYSALSINDNQSRDMRGLFYTPSIFEDRQALYQANAIPLQEIVESKQEVSDHGYYCIEETHSNLTSKTIFIAGLATESKNQLNYNTSDKNIRFYTNLISRDGKSVHIAQLGSWTGRNNFTDAYADSYLEFQFRKRGHTVSLGVNKLDHYAHDVCWIANPAGLPSSEELLSLKSWLLRPNKKLIITYDNNISSAIRIKQLSDLLNSNIKPLYLTVSDEYAKSYASSLTFNVNHPVSTGYNSYSSIQSFITEYSIEFIPLVLAPNTTAICFADPEIYDKKFDTIGYWKMDTGVTKLSIPSISGSGYKLFFTTISETPSENQPLSFVVENATRSPGLPYGDSTGLGVVYAKDNYVISSVGDI